MKRLYLHVIMVMILLSSVFVAVPASGGVISDIKIRDISDLLGNTYVLGAYEDPDTRNIYLVSMSIDLFKGGLVYKIDALSPDMNLIASIDLSNIFFIPLSTGSAGEFRLPVKIVVGDNLYVLGYKFIASTGYNFSVVPEIYVINKRSGSLINNISLGENLFTTDIEWIRSGLSILLYNRSSQELFIRIYSPDLVSYRDYFISNIKDLYSYPENQSLLMLVAMHVYGDEKILVSLSALYSSQKGFESVCGWILVNESSRTIIDKSLRRVDGLCLVSNTYYIKNFFVVIYRDQISIKISRIHHGSSGVVVDIFNIPTNISPSTQNLPGTTFPGLYGESINYVSINDLYGLVTHSILAPETPGSIHQETEIIVFSQKDSSVIETRRISDVVIGTGYVARDGRILFFGGNMRISTLAIVMKPYIVEVLYEKPLTETSTQTISQTATPVNISSPITISITKHVTIQRIETYTIERTRELHISETFTRVVTYTLSTISTTTKFIYRSLFEDQPILLVVIVVASLVTGLIIGSFVLRRTH